MEATRTRKRQVVAEIAPLRELLRTEEEEKREESPRTREQKAQLMGDQELAREMALTTAGNVELAKYTLQGSGAAAFEMNSWRMEVATWSAAELNWRTYQNYAKSRQLADEVRAEEALKEAA